jgi:type II secretory ATPase GspE/PulE/Tfp pilus assembly ATPase PilB-like protein
MNQDRTDRKRGNDSAGKVAADKVAADDVAAPEFSEVGDGVFDPAALSSMETVAVIDAVVGRAAELQASDLFFHTDQYSVDIAIRRLGIVQRLAIVSLEKGRHLISYIKATAGMDIAEHRRPMDGRWLYEGNGRTVDLRVNTIATLFGEDMTLRLWDREVGLRSLDHLGMTGSDLNKLIAMLSSPSGLILVTGPTGTGKTTTLYACLQHLNNGSRKINTLEDPVEYAISGVRQAQINPKLDLDFPELLLNVLRQAPDAIMIGEIRDPPTAATAVRAANSGHLVLATLHAPVAGGAVQSMLALGSHPFFLSSCLLGVIAQRLVRTLCPNCRMAYDISEAPQTFEAIADLLGPNEGNAIYGPGGCDDCLNCGYIARTGLFEVMTLNQSIRRLVAASRPSEEIERAAVAAGMVEFRRGAMLKVAQGVTSTEEILRDVPQEYLGLEE